MLATLLPTHPFENMPRIRWVVLAPARLGHRDIGSTLVLKLALKLFGTRLHGAGCAAAFCSAVRPCIWYSIGPSASEGQTPAAGVLTLGIVHQAPVVGLVP